MASSSYSMPSQSTNDKVIVMFILRLNPLTPTVANCHMVAVRPIKHPVPDHVKPPFVIFDIRAL